MWKTRSLLSGGAPPLRHLLLALVLVGCAGSDTAKPRPPQHASPEQEARATQLLTGPDWYRHAVFYEVFVRSFADANGDGIGDLAGLTSQLDYLKGLGVDALWLTPIMPTPFKDSGYDVSDYRAVNPDYGDMAAFDALLAAAHARGMRIVLDLVLNHTSTAHPWFVESRAAKTGPKADYYVWSDTPSRADIGCGAAGGAFGDSAWTLEPARGQYYFHRFYAAQPDLNYRNPAVVQESFDIVKFWLDKGVDGFRCDVIGALFESATACDLIPETVAYIKDLRKLVDTYPNRVLVAEPDVTSVAPYFGSGRDMVHMAFDFPYGLFWGLAFTGQNRRIAFDALDTVENRYPPGAQDATFIASHDVARSFTTAGDTPWRVRRAFEVAALSKGTPFLYYGDELGLRPGTAVVVDYRDAARTPMAFTRAPGHGFTTGRPWLDFGEGVDQTNVEAEDGDPDSLLSFYRALLAFRRGHAVWGTGEMRLLDVDNPAILAFVRKNEEEAYLVLENFSEDAQDGSAGADEVTTAGDAAWGDGAITVGDGKVRVHVPGGSGGAVKIR